MAPKIVKQKKLLINTNSGVEPDFGSRLTAVPDIPVTVNTIKKTYS
jgi:hypothetical protein